jgi:hypothetical protein
MDSETIFKILSQNCSNFLADLKKCPKGHFLVRGYFYDIQDLKEFNHNLDFRKPKSMNPETHEKINNYFLPIYNWKIRNGIFCYGFDLINRKPVDLGYGPFYIFFPIGEFEFVYSRDHFDLWAYFELTKGDKDEMIKNLKFQNTSLRDAMQLNVEFDYFSNEISVKANAYYLINIKHSLNLVKQIWNSNDNKKIE